MGQAAKSKAVSFSGSRSGKLNRPGLKSVPEGLRRAVSALAPSFLKDAEEKETRTGKFMRKMFPARDRR